MSNNYQFAIEHLMHAESVSEWNEMREGLKKTLTMKEITMIDGSGLIVKSLGQDKYINYHEN